MQKFGWKKKRTSVTIAKERLRLILSSDRVNSTPEYMERIAEELFLTVSKIYRNYTRKLYCSNYTI